MTSHKITYSSHFKLTSSPRVILTMFKKSKQVMTTTTSDLSPLVHYHSQLACFHPLKLVMSAKLVAACQLLFVNCS